MPKFVFREPLIQLKDAARANPQKVGEALSKISAEQGGALKPEHVVEKARDPKHVLHRHFEWDDGIAAEAFRLNQARCLIRAVRVEAEEYEVNAPSFVSVTTAGVRAYHSLGDIQTSIDLQRAVLVQAEKDLLAFEYRYKQFAVICDDVRRVRERVAAHRESLGKSRDRMAG